MMEEMTLNEFKKAMQRKQIYYVVCFILGIATAIIFSSTYVKNQTELTDLIKGLYTGIGSGLAVASVWSFVRALKTMKDESKLKQKKIQDLDERNIKIQGKAKQICYHVTFIALYVGVIVTGVFSPITSMVLCGYILFMAIINSVIVFVFQRKM